MVIVMQEVTSASIIEPTVYREQFERYSFCTTLAQTKAKQVLPSIALAQGRFDNRHLARVRALGTCTKHRLDFEHELEQTSSGIIMHCSLCARSMDSGLTATGQGGEKRTVIGLCLRVQRNAKFPAAAETWRRCWFEGRRAWRCVSGVRYTMRHGINV